LPLLGEAGISLLELQRAAALPDAVWRSLRSLRKCVREVYALSSQVKQRTGKRKRLHKSIWATAM
jgi:hypothetical protein